MKNNKYNIKRKAEALSRRKCIKVNIWNMYTCPDISDRCRMHNGMETAATSITSAVRMIRDRIKQDTSETYWSLSYEPLQLR